MQYYINRNNQQLGPFTEAEVKAQLAAGTISPQDHVWWQGQTGWIPLVQSSLMAPVAAPGLTPPPPAAPAPGVAFAAAQPTATSGMAIASLICACLSLLCGLLSAIPAVVLGHLALGEIKKNPGKGGRGLALSGLIIGYIISALSIAVLAIYLAFLPAILKAAKEQSQSSSIFTPTPSSTNADSSSSDQSTNSPDQSTNSATATPAPPDQSTNSSSTNAPDSSTNAAPASQ